MKIEEYMKKNNISDRDLDISAMKYENASYKREKNQVFNGSHLNAVGSKKVSIVFDVATTQQISKIAKEKGVNNSTIYREAVAKYLTAL